VDVHQRVWLTLWGVALCLATTASATSNNNASKNSSAPAKDPAASMKKAVDQALALEMTSEKLRSQCLKFHAGKPEGSETCKASAQAVSQCVAAYPGPTETAARKTCYELRIKK
jgi:hypothetical protein